ncbi:hydratase, partial [bacterium]|nr:hydratase [bacterium]
DDHRFGLSAAQKYGGIFVPAHQAVIHQYMRETRAECGAMILGSDSHTRYGALGTMAIGEGGPELVKQLVGRTYDIPYPRVVAVYLTGDVKPGTGPQDVALAIIRAVFENGYVKNSVMEFVGPGIGGLSADFRNGIDVMTTETACLSSIWQTDETVRAFYRTHGREEGYIELRPANIAYYDGALSVSLDRIEPMIALPFHPSNVFTIDEVRNDPDRVLGEAEEKAAGHFQEGGRRLDLKRMITPGGIKIDQGIIAGCAGGTFENICAAADILSKGGIGSGHFGLSIYPSSQPVYVELVRTGRIGTLMEAGAVVRSAFCGPCFGAGDVPADGDFSIRHTTRNFPSREGSRPQDGQLAAVALMDARSIAATAANGGILTPAGVGHGPLSGYAYTFSGRAYRERVYDGFGSPDPSAELVLGPNIRDWPAMPPLPENLLLVVAAYITDAVTTTDELIPSGETSSYRSNPFRLAQFTLSRKDPKYVGRAMEMQEYEKERVRGRIPAVLQPVLGKIGIKPAVLEKTGFGSLVAAVKPGDGSAREQAASCQKVLGGWANIAAEYATRRYRSNLVNWGMLPFTAENLTNHPWRTGAFVWLPGIRSELAGGSEKIKAVIIDGDSAVPVILSLAGLDESERRTILDGCLMNGYARDAGESKPD